MKKLLARVLAAAMVVGLLSVSAFAYDLPDNTLLEASNPSSGSATVTDNEGETYTVYLYPAGTVFTSRSAMTNFERVRNLSTGEYQYGINQQFTLPETGAYELTAFDEGIWTTTAYVTAEGSGSAQPDPEPEQPEEPATVAGFTDVAADAWYASFVETVAEKGLFSGNPDGTFAPNANMTYAQFLVVLSQFSGETVTPVEGGAWYEGYVNWAQPLIPAGMAEGFNPNAPITRQDMAALFGTFLNAYDYSAEPVNQDDPAFTDAASIADYADSGVELCYQLGIMSGNTDGSFAPLNTATRAEVAVTMTQMARVMGR